MSEEISFAVPKDLCTNCTKADCRKMLEDKLVQHTYPETFDEFVKLVEDVEGVNLYKDNGDVYLVALECEDKEGAYFNFFRDGDITVDTGGIGEWIIAKGRSPTRMWRIFSDLTMEER